MAFFDKLGETIVNVGKDATQKAKDLSGVAKLNLAVDILEVIRRDRAFYRAAGCDIHKSRSLHGSVDGFKHAAAGCSLFFYNSKLHLFSFRSVFIQ